MATSYPRHQGTPAAPWGEGSFRREEKLAANFYEW